jgi:hypothetical protein
LLVETLSIELAAFDPGDLYADKCNAVLEISSLAFAESLGNGDLPFTPPARWTLTKCLFEELAKMSLIRKADAQSYFAE